MNFAGFNNPALVHNPTLNIPRIPNIIPTTNQINSLNQFNPITSINPLHLDISSKINKPLTQMAPSISNPMIPQTIIPPNLSQPTNQYDALIMAYNNLNGQMNPYDNKFPLMSGQNYQSQLYDPRMLFNYGAMNQFNYGNNINRNHQLGGLSNLIQAAQSQQPQTINTNNYVETDKKNIEKPNNLSENNNNIPINNNNITTNTNNNNTNNSINCICDKNTTINSP
jgi:hypothetical protein